MTGNRRFQAGVLAGCLLLLIFGAKLWVLDRFGSDLPNWDQWDGEGQAVYVPYFQHRLGVLDLFRPHNEHRVFFTKVLNLGLLVEGGQWDARVECVANALLHSIIVAAAFFGGCHLLRPRWWAPLFAICAGLFSLPTPLANILGGFDSQQYFLILFSLGTIATLAFARPYTGAWWGGMVLGVLADFTMASGLLAATAFSGVLVMRVLRGQVTWRDVWPTAAGCAMAVVTGLLAYNPVPDHAYLRATSVQDFVLTVMHSLAWPAAGSSWCALIIYAPIALLAWSAVRRNRNDASAQEDVLLGAAIWILLQFAATGYARGSGGPDPESRYLDTILVGLLVNGLSLAFWLDNRLPAARWRAACWLLAAGWVGVVGWTFWHRAGEALTVDLPRIRSWQNQAENNVRDYVATGDFSCLEKGPIPYPSADELRKRLEEPELRAVLPTSVRPRLRLSPATGTASVFLPGGFSPATPPLDHARTWGCYAVGGSRPRGEWLSAAFTPAFDGYLKIEMAGSPGTSGVTLSVLDAASGRLLASAQPSRVPGDSWRAAYVRVPRRPVVLRASADPGDAWFAFGEPAEMSLLSFRAWWLAKQGRLIVVSVAAAAAVLWLAYGTGAWRDWRRQRRTSG